MFLYEIGLKKSMKQAEIASTPIFIFFGLIVLCSIAAIAYHFLFTINDSSSVITMTQFQQQLKNDMVQTSEYGSTLSKDYLIPQEYAEICFTDSEASSFLVEKQNPLVEDSVRDGTDLNIYLVGKEMYTFTIEGIRLNKQIKCIKSDNGKVKLTLTGLGYATLIQ